MILEFWNSKINIFEKIKIESQLIIQKNLYFIETLGPGRSYDHVGQYETVVMNSTRGNAVLGEFGLLFPIGLVENGGFRFPNVRFRARMSWSGFLNYFQ